MDFGERMAIGHDVVESTPVLRTLDLNSIVFDTSGDVSIENLQVRSVNSSNVYTFNMVSDVDGEKIVNVADACVADLAGNRNVRSNEFHWTRDTVSPIATLNIKELEDLSQEVCDETLGLCAFEKRIILDELDLVINFTEPMKFLSKDIFRLTGMEIRSLLMTSSTSYIAKLDISKNQGKDSLMRSIELPSSSIEDFAGNEAENSVRLDWRVDHTIPYLESVSAAQNHVPLNGFITNERTINITFRFNEPVCCIEDFTNRFVVTPSDRFSFENVSVMDINRTTFTGILRVTDSDPIDTEISLEVRRQNIMDRSGNSAEEGVVTEFTRGACAKLSSYPTGNPYIYIEDAWRPICGHFFSNNDHGCDTICKRSGYGSGTRTSQGEIYAEDAFWIGECAPDVNSSDIDLLRCSNGGNRYETYPKDTQNCLAGNEIGVTCTCEDALSSDAGT